MKYIIKKNEGKRKVIKKKDSFSYFNNPELFTAVR